MPIRVTLDRVLLDRRMSLTELSDRVGVTLANLSILKTGKAKAVRFSTLEALCRELHCQPADLLVFDEKRMRTASKPRPSEFTPGLCPDMTISDISLIKRRAENLFPRSFYV